MGGKTALRPILYQLFPNNYDRLVEVFGGGASVLFGKEPDHRAEIYNDLNGDLYNLFMCVKNRPLSLVRELGFLPFNSRQEFKVIRKFVRKEEFTDDYLAEEMELCERYMKPPESIEMKGLLLEQADAGDVKRAAAFYKMIRYSYGGSGSSYGGKSIDIRRSLHLIWACSRRLADVVIENLSFEEAIPKYDAPGTLLYLDPPYYQAECYDIAFSLEDHYKLRNLIGRCRGYTALSYNDQPFIRHLYKGFWQFSVKRLNNMAQRFDSGSEYEELIILNYNPRAHPKNEQLNLFQSQKPPEYQYTLISEGEEK